MRRNCFFSSFGVVLSHMGDFWRHLRIWMFRISVSLSVCLSLSLSLYLSLSGSLSLSLLSIFFSKAVPLCFSSHCLSRPLFTDLCVCLSLSLSVSISHKYFFLCAPLYNCPFMFLLSLPVPFSVHRSLSVCLSHKHFYSMHPPL